MNFSDIPKKINRQCPLCGARLDDNDLHILKEVKDGHLIVYSSCVNCNVGMIAKVAVAPNGLVGVGILTDMDKDELIKLGDQDKVSAEDVLQIKILADKGYLKIKK